MRKGDLVKCPVIDPCDRFRILHLDKRYVVIQNVEGRRFTVSRVCVVKV